MLHKNEHRKNFAKTEYMPIMSPEKYKGKHFLVIWCPGGATRPYSSPKNMAKENRERFYYIRKGSNSVVPNDDELKDLFNLANRVPFDDRVNHKAELSDLNLTLIRNYLKIKFWNISEIVEMDIGKSA